MFRDACQSITYVSSYKVGSPSLASPISFFPSFVLKGSVPFPRLFLTQVLFFRSSILYYQACLFLCSLRILEVYKTSCSPSHYSLLSSLHSPRPRSPSLSAVKRASLCRPDSLRLRLSAHLSRSITGIILTVFPTLTTSSAKTTSVAKTTSRQFSNKLSSANKST